MKCPFCQQADSRVLDSRPVEEGAAVRRRRECAACGRRFTTYERLEEQPLMVVKKDGRREPFSHQKLLDGLALACRKRPVATEELGDLVAAIERQLRRTALAEVESRRIGELAMQLLRHLDEVAYVRFASVYREFNDVHSFVREIEKLTGAPGSQM